MCRIAGIIDPIRYQDQITSDIQSMCDVMQPGGPDDFGYFIQNSIALGHRRLSILDLSENGHQPMFSQDQRYVIVFNGEIYNFKTIKVELIELGYHFKSNSDTEVILNAFIEWKEQAFSKFNGMFAFALYDTIEKEIYLVRDHAGIKPLYFYHDNQQLYFASEVKAFKKLGLTNNNFWQILFLSYGFIPEPFTTLEDVYSLPKGSYFKFNTNTGKGLIHNYQNFERKKIVRSNQELQFHLQQTLYQSVERNLISDAPIGLFLSGGIDSSLLTLLARNYTRDLHTLSIEFDEPGYSEKKYQDIIVSKTRANHTGFLIQQSEFEEELPGILTDYDQPSNDAVNSWFISKYARKNNLKAVLSGLGADELFGGYPSFKRVDYLELLQKVKFAAPVASKLLGGKFNRLDYLKLSPELSTYLLLRGFYAPNEVAKILDCEPSFVLNVLMEKAPKIPTNLKGYGMISYMEQSIYMQNQLLKDTDYMSMRHGLEVRVPFLDKELMELVATIEDKQLFAEPGRKSLLIDTFKNILPQEIWNRPKMGFSFPFQKWLKNSDLLKSLLPISKTAAKMYTDFNKDKIHWSKMWALVQLKKFN